MRKKEEDSAVKLMRATSSVLLGGAIALAICLLILFLCSMGISSGFLDDHAMVQYTIAGCVIGSFGGGFYAVMHIRSKTLLVGLGASAIQFLLILTIGFLMYPGISAAQNGIGVAAGCFAGGAIAGILGGKPKKKRRK